MKKQKKVDKRAILDYTIIVLGIAAIVGFWMNLDYILKPQNKTILSSADREIEKRNVNLVDMETKKHIEVEEAKKRIEEERKSIQQKEISKQEQTQNQEKQMITIQFTDLKEEQKKKEEYVKQGGIVGKTQYEIGSSNPEKNDAATLKSEEEVKPILEEQAQKEQQQERFQKHQKEKEREETKRIAENLENSKLEKDLTYLNEGERWYQGGTPKTKDVKVENNKKYLYVEGVGWINWKVPTKGGGVPSEGKYDTLSGIKIGY